MRRFAYFVLVLALCLTNPPESAARDAWYEDVNGHWARQWIEVLWDEDVADGFIYKRYMSWCGSMYEVEVAYYKPDNYTTRAELAMLLAKAFDLPPMPQCVSFDDIPRDYSHYGWKRPHPYIEAAYYHGIVKGTGDNRFSPSSTATRQEAIAMIVRGLGLAEFCGALSESQVDEQLSRFRDGHSTEESLRREVATAIYLRIIEGYPDGTLKPAWLLTRAEAATIVARSCLIRCEARPRAFSPDGDGIEDVTGLYVKTLRNRNLSEWGVQVVDSGLRCLKSWSGWARRDNPVAPPSSLTWDGRDYGGLMCGDGLYFYQSWIRDRNGLLLMSAMKPLVIERPAVWAFANPDRAYPGDTVAISAFATGQPVMVRLRDDGTNLRYSSGQWSTPWEIASEAPQGTLQICVEADYASGARREASATLVVLDPFGVNAILVPTVVIPGQQVTVKAVTTRPADEVAVNWPWGEPQQLSLTSDTSYEAQSWTQDLEDGAYPVVVTAWFGTKTRSVTLTLTVDASPLRQLAPVLVS